MKKMHMHHDHYGKMGNFADRVNVGGGGVLAHDHHTPKSLGNQHGHSPAAMGKENHRTASHTGHGSGSKKGY